MLPTLRAWATFLTPTLPDRADTPSVAELLFYSGFGVNVRACGLGGREKAQLNGRPGALCEKTLRLVCAWSRAERS
jgi:hypothetical protein